jgi:hypothetical protein
MKERGFILDKSLYKLGSMMKARGFNCHIVMLEKGYTEEALRLATTEGKVFLL